jgi:hypothetical protein
VPDEIAQSDLASMWEQGFGVKQGYAAAMAWYRKAADRGFAGAEHNLGLRTHCRSESSSSI